MLPFDTGIGVAVKVGVAVGNDVAVGNGVGVIVGVGVAVGIGDGVGVAVGIGIGVDVGIVMGDGVNVCNEGTDNAKGVGFTSTSNSFSTPEHPTNKSRITDIPNSRLSIIENYIKSCLD